MLYILAMKKRVGLFQEKALGAIAAQSPGFYLAGGTALSLFYFHHRESLDLDFFSQRFDRGMVEETMKKASSALGKKIELVAEESRKGRVKILVYHMHTGKNKVLKVDFVQDYLELLKPAKRINGVSVLSLEDIYLRKIYAACGTLVVQDEVGRTITVGGRQEVKDFYDLYSLSHTFMRLSEFSSKFCNRVVRESLIRWFRTYDRMSIKTGLLELKVNNGFDYKDIERHFKKEIDTMLEKELGAL